MKRLVLALALTCALSATGLAGNIPSDGIASPGNIPSDGIASPEPTAPQTTSIAATVILTIIGLMRR